MNPNVNSKLTLITSREVDFPWIKHGGKCLSPDSADKGVKQFSWLKRGVGLAHEKCTPSQGSKEIPSGRPGLVDFLAGRAKASHPLTK